MDFGNQHTDGFAAFYDALRRDMMAPKPAYTAALQKSYANSADYRNAILKAYRDDGFNLPVDLTEPDERIKFEMWNYFSRQSYDSDAQRLLFCMDNNVKTFDVMFPYNSDCIAAAECIYDALKASGVAPDGAKTIGAILKTAPYPLKEPPEFCPRVTSAQAEQGIGPRRLVRASPGLQPE